MRPRGSRRLRATSAAPGSTTGWPRRWRAWRSRRSPRTPTQPTPLRGASGAPPRAPPSAAGDDRLPAVLAAVRALPERERQAVVLQAFGGASNAEVAARLGTTEAAGESILVLPRGQRRTPARR